MCIFIEFLILFSLLLVFIEIVLSSGGILAFSGIVSFILAFVLMFIFRVPVPELFLTITVPAFMVLFVLSLVVIILAYRAHRRKPLIGEKSLIGKTGRCVKRIERDTPGLVEIDGEIWSAFSDDIIEEGQKVRVVDQESIKLKVRKEV